MKVKKNLFMRLTLIASLSGIISCGDGNDEPQNTNDPNNPISPVNPNNPDPSKPISSYSINGFWENIESDGDFDECFYFEESTHSITYQYIYDDNNTISREIMAEGTYSISGNTITALYKDVSVSCENGANTLNGFKNGQSRQVQYTIISCTAAKLTLTDFMERIITFEKSEETPNNTPNEKPTDDPQDNPDRPQQSVKVTTMATANPGWSNAFVSGTISGVNENVEVGFIYGKTRDLSVSHGEIIKTTSRSNFQMTITELIDDETYYYRAYAFVNNKYHYGEIQSFKTEPFTYKIDGITYKMIRVEGGPMPAFSMMEVEIPPQSKIQVGTENILYERNGDDIIVKTEMIAFIYNLRSVSGLHFRIPTQEEWQYAASGGNKNRGFSYSGSNSIENVAWYKSNSNGSAHPIAQKMPNELGLYDMSGNYGEITNNTSDEFYIDGNICGGSWNDNASDCKVNSFKVQSNTGKIRNTNLSNKNCIDGLDTTVRLVYSRE